MASHFLFNSVSDVDFAISGAHQLLFDSNGQTGDALLHGDLTVDNLTVGNLSTLEDLVIEGTLNVDEISLQASTSGILFNNPVLLDDVLKVDQITGKVVDGGVEIEGLAITGNAVGVESLHNTYLYSDFVYADTAVTDTLGSTDQWTTRLLVHSTGEFNKAIFSHGDISITGSSSVGLILKSPDDSLWRITIDDSGALNSTSL